MQPLTAAKSPMDVVVTYSQDYGAATTVGVVQAVVIREVETATEQSFSPDINESQARRVTLWASVLPCGAHWDAKRGAGGTQMGGRRPR